MVSSALESSGKTSTAVCLSDSVKMELLLKVIVHLAREAPEEGWGWEPDCVERSGEWSCGADVVTHSLQGFGYKGEERHQVAVGEECGVERGFIFKMGDGVEMQMERRRKRGR